jgi:hypothetical protein
VSCSQFQVQFLQGLQAGNRHAATGASQTGYTMTRAALAQLSGQSGRIIRNRQVSRAGA